LLHLYTGDGKGKTSAAVGLAVRAAGSGCPVIFAQFLKSALTGELASLEALDVLVIRSQQRFGFTFQMDEETRLLCAAEQHGLLVSVREALAQRVAQDAPSRAPAGPASAPTGPASAPAAPAPTASAPAGPASAPAGPRALIVLDEALDAFDLGFLDEGELRAFIEDVPQDVELALTGRQAPAWLAEQAAYHTEMRKIRHPWDNGIPARPAIEY
jgi:cob(I)alamin adenosyltransferase